MPCWDEKRWWGARPRVWGWPSLKRSPPTGAVVHGLSRDDATLSAAMQDLPGSGHRATAVDFDHSDELGNVVGDACYDILIHNTGGPAAGPLADADPDDLDAAFRRHVRSAHVLMQQVLARNAGPRVWPHCVGRFNECDHAHPRPWGFQHHSQRHRQLGPNPGGRVGWGWHHVNCLLPGFTDTDRLTSLIEGRANRQGQTPEQVRDAMIASVPAGRLGHPGELAALAAFLCSEAAGYVNGTTIPVDGGRVVAG